MSFEPPPALVDRIHDRIDAVPPWVLLVQLFIGFGWLRAATEKVIDVGWWSGQPILEFLDGQEATRLGWYEAFTQALVIPNVVAVAVVVVLAQAAIGAALVANRGTGPALLAGMALNLHFLLAGAVDPSIFYLVAQAAVGLWLLDARSTLRPDAKVLDLLQLVALVMIGSSVPFIATIHPAHAVEDPALVLVFFGALVAVGVESVRRRANEVAPAPAASSVLVR